MSFTGFFISDLIAAHSLPRDTLRKLPGLVFSAGVMFAVSAVLSFFCFSTGCFPAFFAAVAACVAVAVALFVLKRGNAAAASYTVSGALCAAAAAVFCARASSGGSGSLFFAVSLFSVIGLCAYGCSLFVRQLQLLCAVFVLLFAVAAGYAFDVVPPAETALSFAGLLAVVLLVLHTAKTAAHAAGEIDNAESESGRNLDSLTRLVTEAKEFFTLGLRLQTETGNAQNSLDELSEFYNYLIRQADDLTGSISVVKNAGDAVKEQTDKISVSVQEQNNSITQTSAAMTEIAATLRNISSIADKRRIMMNSLVETFNSQQQLLDGLIGCIVDVRASSEAIAGFVDTVDEIASRTGLLAMNASIEAAHAGNAGKGFAVIAHEIRKLSDQTSSHAAKISEALKNNAKIVAGTADTAGRFGEQIKHTTVELNSTADAMQEILSGISEMNIGTQDIMRSLQNIVEHSRTSTALVSAVVAEVTAQSAATKEMTSFADALQQRVMSLEMLVGLIQMVITNIKLEAERTTEMSRNISAILDVDAAGHSILEAEPQPGADEKKEAHRELLDDILDAANIVPSGLPPPVPAFDSADIASHDLSTASAAHTPEHATAPEPVPVAAAPTAAPELAPGEEFVSIDDFLN